MWAPPSASRQTSPSSSLQRGVPLKGSYLWDFTTES
uniref:TUBGCP5 n=1 Tax=Arundo donax TaxID=35708 RepID=A0A0A9GG99_ARUDO